MLRSMARGALAAIIFLSTAEFSEARAQAPTVEQIQDLERKLDALQRQADELRAEIGRLKGAETTAPTQPEDLTAIEPLEPAETPVTTEPSDLDARIVENPSPQLATIFNPDISVIGNLLGHAGDDNPFDERESVALREAEISLQAYVDPYARAAFFIGVGDEGAELEEGYIEFVTLPFDLTAKAGKLKASFGKVNTQHAHNWLWVDRPLVSRAFFGDHGLADSGVSVSRLFPNRWNLFVEATGEVFRGTVHEVFEPDESEFAWVGHLKTYRDLADSTNIEAGASIAQGTATAGVTSRFTGVDLTYRWRPLERSIYRSFISRTEIIHNDREDQPEAALGVYTSAEYQFARRWSAGARLDGADRPEAPWLTDRGGALTLTFRPSEFSQIRAELRRTEYEAADDATELLLQVQFGIGAHGAHTY